MAALSPRPSPHPLQHRRATSARRSSAFRGHSSGSPATPAHSQRPSSRTSSRTPSYAQATATSTSRKRARPGSRQTQRWEQSQTGETPGLGSTWAVPSLEDSVVRSDFASPEPFVSTRYNLAGGLDTPGQAREHYFESHSHSYSQHQDDYGMRRRRWTHSDASPETELVWRRPSSTNGVAEQQTWGQFVFSVAGKVWQFGSSAFKGFYAGGGQGYGLEKPPAVRVNSEDMWESMPSTDLRLGRDRDSTPVPGSFPVDDEPEESERPAKKVHMNNGESPWVMVQNPMEAESPRRKTLHQPPPPSRTPAAVRRSLIPISRRASGYQDQSGSPASQTYRSASYAHQRSTSDITPGAKASPLSPEAHKYLQDRKREEKQQDASIKRMNDQLKALLKEGRQALGTKIEVVMDDDGMDMEDEGYFEDSR